MLHPWFVAALLLLVALTLSACAGDEPAARPTQVPTRIPPTPTPRSTALPEVPTAVPLGVAPRQFELHFAVLGADPGAGAASAASDLTRYLNRQLDLEIPVVLEDETSAYEAACSGAPYAAWVNAYTMAEASQNCGAIPVLAVVRGRAPLQTIGATAEVVASSEIDALDQLAGTVFCRSDERELFTTWIFPGLLMAAQGVDPLMDLAAVQDYADDRAVLGAIAAGECSAASFPPNAFSELRSDLPAEQSSAMHLISRAGDTSRPTNAAAWSGYGARVVPYEVLIFPPESAVPEAQRTAIVEAISAFFADRASGDVYLRDLLDATGVIEVQPDDFADFLSMMDAANWQLVSSE